MPRNRSERGAGTDRSDGSERDRFGEWKALWRKISDLVLRILAVLEDFGNVLLDGLDLGREMAAFLAGRTRPVLALGAAIGGSSPLTDGWGIEALASPPWSWIPVAGVPAAFGLVALVLASFGPLEREAIRHERRREAERPDPEVEHDLKMERQRRRMITEQLNEMQPRIALEDQDFVSDDLAELYFDVNSSPQSHGLKLALMKWGPTKLDPVAKRGEIPEPLRSSLELEWDDLTGMREALDTALDPLRYRHEAIAFSAGPNQHYVLIGLAGATISPEVRREISTTATLLLAHHAYGEKIPAWMKAWMKASTKEEA